MHIKCMLKESIIHHDLKSDHNVLCELGGMTYYFSRKKKFAPLAGV